jgi:hypothetical protein
VSTHKVFIANAVYPRFTSTPSKYRNFPGRADTIADLVRQSGADCATFGEMGYYEARTLAQQLPGWQYDRAQGTGSAGAINQGLNSVWSKESVWDQPEDRVSDYNMPSAGQWQRTLIICRLIEKADPTAFVGLGAYHETLGNAAKMAYTKALVQKVGDRRVLLGGDFPRTDDDDDLAYMKRNGFTVHERTSATPMACFTKGAVTVTDVDHRTSTTCFDHGYLVVSFSIPNKKDA